MSNIATTFSVDIMRLTVTALLGFTDNLAIQRDIAAVPIIDRRSSIVKDAFRVFVDMDQ